MAPTPIICHFMDYAAEYSGTFVDAILALAGYCRESLQLELVAFLPDAARGRRWLTRFDAEGIRYRFVPRRRNVVREARTALGRDVPVVIHTHFARFDLTAIVLKAFCHRRARLIWHFHETGRRAWWKPATDLIKIRLLARRFVDAFIAVGDGPYRAAIERGVPRGRLRLVPNGVQVARFTPNLARRRETRRALGVAEDAPVFLLLGWDPRRKGVDVFVRAAHELVLHHGRRASFWVVGRQETIEAIATLPESERLASTLRLWEPREDFPAMLEAADVFVLASRSEGFPYAVAEAMAAGKLVLSSDIPGVREVAGVEGVWLFPSEDWKALGRLMTRACQLADTERARLGDVNSRYAADRLSLQAWTRQIGDVYRTLLGATNAVLPAGSR